MKISFYTLGCKLNQAETEDLKQELTGLGAVYCTIFREKADVSVIRACGVTIDASQTTREIIRQAKHRGAYVIAMGCLENSDMPEIDFKTGENDEVVKHLLENFSFGREKNFVEQLNRTRAFVSKSKTAVILIAHTVIPSSAASRPEIDPKKIIAAVNKKTTDGFKEITLTGVNICQYKYGTLDLAGLLEET